MHRALVFVTRMSRDVKSFASGVLTFSVGPNAKINERQVKGLIARRGLRAAAFEFLEMRCN